MTKAGKTRDSLEQPSAARRALLTGGAAAAGLAAFAGGTLAEAPPADAATTPYVSISDWINVLDNPYGSNAFNDGSTECSQAIQEALTGVGNNPNTGQVGGVVYMPAGTYLVGGPLTIPTGVTLLGAMPVGANDGAKVDKASGTVIVPDGSAGPGWSATNPGVISVNGPETTDIQYRTAVGNLWIDATNSPGFTKLPDNLAGISITGAAYHGEIFNVGIRSMPGNGLWFTSIVVTNGDTTTTLRTDGWMIDNVIIQSVNQGTTVSSQPAGVYWDGQDSTFSRVHVQAAQASTLNFQAGFYLANANNCRFIGCRADQNGDAGWVADSNPGGSPDSPGSTIALVGCGTENNGNYGLRVINSSSNSSGNNDQPRTPVVCTGCSFDFDGQSNTSNGGGVFVQGISAVVLSGCDITTGGNTYPQNALVTAETVTLFGTPTSGTSGSGVPQWIHAVGGIWNCNGSDLVVDAAGANPIIDVGAVTGGPWTDISTISPVTPVVSGQYLCPPISYAPSAQAALAVNTTSMAAFDSVHLKTGPFTAPLSGDVVVTASFSGAASTAGVFTAFGLAAHGSVSPIVGNEWITKESASTAVLPFTISFLVTELTAGSNYNFDLLGACTSGDTFTIYAIGQNSATPTLSSSGQGSPVVVTVQAV